MKLTTFTYKDQKGRVTNRQVLVLQEPSDKMSAIDVTESDDETVVSFALAYEASRKAFLAEVEALQNQYDLKHRFRQFFTDSMQDVSTEVL